MNCAQGSLTFWGDLATVWCNGKVFSVLCCCRGSMQLCMHQARVKVDGRKHIISRWLTAPACGNYHPLNISSVPSRTLFRIQIRSMVPSTKTKGFGTHWPSGPCGRKEMRSSMFHGPSRFTGHWRRGSGAKLNSCQKLEAVTSVAWVKLAVSFSYEIQNFKSITLKNNLTCVKY